MRKILLPILSTIFSLTSFTAANVVLAQTASNECDRGDNIRQAPVCESDPNQLTEQKWQRLAKRYYRSREGSPV